MSPTTRHVKKHPKARQRRCIKAQERLARDRRLAQHATTVLEQASMTWASPKTWWPRLKAA